MIFHGELLDGLKTAGLPGPDLEEVTTETRQGDEIVSITPVYIYDVNSRKFNFGTGCTYNKYTSSGGGNLNKVGIQMNQIRVMGNWHHN